MKTEVHLKQIVICMRSVMFWIVCLPIVTASQVFMGADNALDPYARIQSKGYGVEETTLHPGVKHIAQEWDTELKRWVFVFTIHKDLDGDSGERIDRQRLEIKTYGPSPATMKAAYGETHTYRWKFKLDAGFQPSPNFCHIHQIKAGDGSDADSPLMTITPRAGSPDKLQLIFTAPTGTSGSGTLKQVDLAPFKGTWVEAFERTKFTEKGTYELIIRRVSDDTELFQYKRDSIAMWRTGSTFMRPKYGIYRSLNSLSYLRDESVRFADFGLVEGELAEPPASPSALTLTPLSWRMVRLSWSDNSADEDLFRVERSTAGTGWRLVGYAANGGTTFVDSDLTASTVYRYRVRSENTIANSAFCDSALVTTSSLTRAETDPEISSQFKLQCYPNPFNPSTAISYQLVTKDQVRLEVFDTPGRKVAVLVNEEKGAGNHVVVFNAERLTSGTYYATIQVGGVSKSIKLLLVR